MCVRTRRLILVRHKYKVIGCSDLATYRLFAFDSSIFQLAFLAVRNKRSPKYCFYGVFLLFQPYTKSHWFFFRFFCGFRFFLWFLIFSVLFLNFPTVFFRWFDLLDFFFVFLSFVSFAGNLIDFSSWHIIFVTFSVSVSFIRITKHFSSTTNTTETESTALRPRTLTAYYVSISTGPF